MTSKPTSNFSSPKKCFEEPVAFIQPSRPSASANKPMQPPREVVRKSASGSTSRSRGPSPSTVGRSRERRDEDDVEEEVLHDVIEDFNQSFSFQPRNQSSDKKALVGKGDKCGGRPIGRYIAAIATDLLILVSGIMFLQEADTLCHESGYEYPACISSGRVPAQGYGMVCFIIAGVCQLVALICALLSNFRKKRTLSPFAGTSISMLAIVSGFCGGILASDLDRSAPGMGVGLVGFFGFCILGVVKHGGMSLRKPPPAGSAYNQGTYW